MSKETVWYLVKTSNGQWARAEKLENALDMCGVLIKKGKNKNIVKSDVQVLAWKNTQTEANRLTEDLAKYYSDHWDGGPWSVGDYWAPAVDDSGRVVALGKMELVIKNFVNE